MALLQCCNVIRRENTFSVKAEKGLDVRISKTGTTISVLTTWMSFKRYFILFLPSPLSSEKETPIDDNQTDS